MNESGNVGMKNIWQCQPVEGIPMSVQQIRKQAGKFEKQIVWRNVREYAGALIAAALFSFSFATTHDPLFRSGFVLLIAGLVYVAYQLHRKGSPKSLPVQMGAVSCLQFHRSELERQRDLVGSVWSWYLGPLIPGLAVLTIAMAVANPRPGNIGGVMLMATIIAAFFVFVGKLNARAARSLQRLIDELSTAEGTR
jgi:lipopolysaccharide export LptBFGC system permease protein LptF